MENAIGIDLGGSKVIAVKVGRDFRIVKKVRADFSGKSRKEVLDKVLCCIDSLSDNGTSGIGMGIAGVVKNGVLVKSPNMKHMEKTDFKKLLGKKYGKKVVCENDARCFAFAEAARTGAKNFIALTLGTGIGAGIFIDGSLYMGKNSAGEIGHMTIKYDGLRCHCGNTGCYEEYASGRGVERLCKKITGKKISPKEANELASKSDRKAKKVWDEYGRLVGAGLASLCYIFDPELIIIGGGISGAFGHFEKSMREEMRKRLFIPLPEIKTGLPEDNAFGAACMTLRK